jgi:hypothetical protein
MFTVWALLIIIAMVFVLAPLAQGIGRRMNPPELPGVSPHDVARLREELDQLAAQVGRLQDEQSFMLRLLTEGDAARGKLSRGTGDAGEALSLEEQREAGRQDRGRRIKPDTHDGGL